MANKLKGIIPMTEGVHEYGKLSGSELYKEIEKIANDLPNHLPAKDISIPLAYSLHEFKSDTMADIYSDLEKHGMLNPVGYGILSHIPYLKDKMISQHYPIRKAPRIIKGATGYYYLRKLTRSQRKEWLKEFRLHNRNHFQVIDWLSSNFTDMEDFIACSFSWGNSVKGLEYWSKIADYGRWNTKPDKLSAQHIHDVILKIHNDLKS